jgi:formylglycine-generating enzyme required for sulfatase activity
VKVGESHVQPVKTGKKPLDQPLLPKFFFNPAERNAEYILIDGAKERIVFESTGKPAPTYPVYFAKYPVTNALYRRFIDYLAGVSEDETLVHLRREDFAESLWTHAEKIEGFTDCLESRTPTRWADKFRSSRDDDKRFNGDDQPVVGVSWYAAVAYCHWLCQLRIADCGFRIEQTLHQSEIRNGFDRLNPAPQSEIKFRLPTEAEWEWAASGGTRRYPWGDEAPDKTRANYGGRVNHTTPVGAYPAGATPDGTMDMAGNVWEWMENPYTEGEIWRALRGGAWYGSPAALVCAARDVFHPVHSYNLFGFRVLRFQSGF